jgi:hypothetical protein
MEILRNIRNSHTFRLRKKPVTFMEGLVAVFCSNEEITDKYNLDKTDEQADFNSLESDWKAIGKDLNYAINVYANNSK